MERDLLWVKIFLEAIYCYNNMIKNISHLFRLLVRGYATRGYATRGYAGVRGYPFSFPALVHFHTPEILSCTPGTNETKPFESSYPPELTPLCIPELIPFVPRTGLSHVSAH